MDRLTLTKKPVLWHLVGKLTWDQLGVSYNNTMCCEGIRASPNFSPNSGLIYSQLYVDRHECCQLRWTLSVINGRRWSVINLSHSLKIWSPALSEGPMPHDSLRQSYLRHGVAVDPKVVKGHTLWHTYTANNVKTPVQLEETDHQMIQLTWWCTFGGPGTCVPV